MANQRDFEKSRKVRETSIVDRISFLLFYNVWEEAPAQTPRRAVWEGPSPSPGRRQGEQRPRSRCLTFSKGQYLYILMGLVQMKTSVLGRERSGEAVCPEPPCLGPYLPPPLRHGPGHHVGHQPGACKPHSSPRAASHAEVWSHHPDMTGTTGEGEQHPAREALQDRTSYQGHQGPARRGAKKPASQSLGQGLVLLGPQGPLRSVLHQRLPQPQTQHPPTVPAGPLPLGSHPWDTGSQLSAKWSREVSVRLWPWVSPAVSPWSCLFRTFHVNRTPQHVVLSFGVVFSRALELQASFLPSDIAVRHMLPGWRAQLLPPGIELLGTPVLRAWWICTSISLGATAGLQPAPRPGDMAAEAAAASVLIPPSATRTPSSLHPWLHLFFLS